MRSVFSIGMTFTNRCWIIQYNTYRHRFSFVRSSKPSGKKITSLLSSFSSLPVPQLLWIKLTLSAFPNSRLRPRQNTDIVLLPPPNWKITRLKRKIFPANTLRFHKWNFQQKAIANRNNSRYWYYNVFYYFAIPFSFTYIDYPKAIIIDTKNKFRFSQTKIKHTRNTQSF